MPNNTITITLDDILGPDGLEGAWEGMVQKLADSAASKWLHSEAGPGYSGKSFHDACVRAINQAVQTKIAEHIEKLITKPVQRTDNYGKPKGEPFTFQEMLGKAVETALTQKYNSYGEPTGQKGKTLFEKAVEEISTQEIKKKVEAAVKEVKLEATTKIGKLIAEALAAEV